MKHSVALLNHFIRLTWWNHETDYFRYGKYTKLDVCDSDRHKAFWTFQKVQNGKYCKNLAWKTNFQHAVTFQLFLKAFLSKIQKLLFPKEILLFSSLPHRHVNHTLTFENPLVSQSHMTSPDLFCCVLFSLLSHWKVHEDFFRNERHEVSWKKWMRHLYITLVRSSRRKTYNTRSRKRHEKLLECCNWHIFFDRIFIW